LVHPRDGHPKIFAMIDAYLDESGIHDGAVVCVIAGYFGGRGKWRKFEDDWKQLLRDFKVPMEKFHAKSFFPYPKPGGFFHNEWKGDYKAFHGAIAETIARHRKIHPVSAGIIVPDFKSFSLDERKFMTGATRDLKSGKLRTSGCPSKPYFVPFQHVVMQICRYAPVGGKAHFFFGIDRPFYRYATVLFQQMKTDVLQGGPWAWKRQLGDPSAPRAANTAQLQIADFLANLTYHHMIDAGPNLGLVQPSLLLYNCIQNRRTDEDFYFSTAKNLRRTLDENTEFTQTLRENFVLSRPDGSSGSGH
jgi:hypothetical protein